MIGYYSKLKKLSFRHRVLESESWARDEAYESLDLFNRNYVFVKKIASLVPKKVKILDLGCGSGAILLMLAQLRPDITLTGIDISNYALMQARKNEKELKIDREIYWLKGAIGKGPAPKIQYDYIISHYVAHHLSNLSLIFEEIINDLPRGGQFYIRDFLRPKDGNEAVLQIGSTSSPMLTESQYMLHFSSLRASFSFEEVKNAVSHYSNNLPFSLKRNKYFWDLIGYKK